MEGRSTVYNMIQKNCDINNYEINKKNRALLEEFTEYLHSVDRSIGTIYQYQRDIEVFFIYNYEHNDNKDFTKITKRDLIKFQNYALGEWGWSPSRLQRVKSSLSSMSNYIEMISDEDEELEGFRNIIHKIPNPPKKMVREKSVFETENIDELLSELIDNHKYMQACMLSLAMNSGRRKAELCRFKTNYFNDENIVFDALYRTPEKVKTKGRGKDGKQLNLYVLKPKFEPFLKLWLKEREKLGISEYVWLFPSRNKDGTWEDTPISVSVLDGWKAGFSEYLQKPFYWHSMRHLFTTNCQKANIPPSITQEIMGWASLDMVGLYDDTNAEDELGKYFSKDGIVAQKEKRLYDI